jgi:hypothetical protein
MSVFLVLVLALLCGLVLAGAAVSVLALFRAQTMIRVAAAGAKTIQGQRDGEIESLRDGLSGLAAQLRDLQHDTPLQVTPAMPRPGLNLNKRSQALRMHRRGETAEQIAPALELPLQEVQLLIKVQQIVLSSV